MVTVAKFQLRGFDWEHFGLLDRWGRVKMVNYVNLVSWVFSFSSATGDRFDVLRGFKKNYILREIPKTSFMDFGLLYENDKGGYVVLNGVRMADIRRASLVCLLVYVSTYCVPITLFRQNKPFGPRPNKKTHGKPFTVKTCLYGGY